MYPRHTCVAQCGKYNVIVGILYVKWSLTRYANKILILTAVWSAWALINLVTQNLKKTIWKHWYKKLLYTGKCKGGKSSLKSYRENQTDLHGKQPKFY